MSTPDRDPYDKSFARFVRGVGGGGQPKPDVTERPRHDDEAPGPSLFRTLVESGSLEELTLPGLFIGRSEVLGVNFARSDLHLSTLSWNDLEDCAFDESDLSDSDLRASHFVHCTFTGTELARCDLRHATFRGCDFTGANLAGALVATAERAALGLTESQAAAVAWTEDPGPEPPGG